LTEETPDNHLLHREENVVSCILDYCGWISFSWLKDTGIDQEAIFTGFLEEGEGRAPEGSVLDESNLLSAVIFAVG